MDSFDPGTGNVVHPKTVVISDIKSLRVTFNKRVLYQKYVQERRSLRQISAEFASSKTAIRQALIRFQIPLRERCKAPYRVHNLPFGSRNVKGKVVAHKCEKTVIHSIIKMHNEGLSNCAISRVLTELKTPTKQQGRKWHPEMVRKILFRFKNQSDSA